MNFKYSLASLLLLCALVFVPAGAAYSQEAGDYAFGLQSSSSAVRLKAIYGLSRLGTPESVDLLASHYGLEKDAYLRQQLVDSIDISVSTGAVGLVRLAARDQNPHIRKSALGRLSSQGESAALGDIGALLKVETDPSVMTAAVSALSVFKSTAAVGLVDNVLSDRKRGRKLRLFSVGALDRIGTKEARTRLGKHAADSDAEVKKKVAGALGKGKKN